MSPEELTAALDDPSPEVARVAMRRLVGLLGAGAAAALRARVLRVDLSLVADFTKALQRIGDDEVLGIATTALQDQRSTRRLAAIRALGALADRRAVQQLRAALDDDVGGVRAAALDALAQLGEDGGASIGADCARLVSDPIPHVRIAAVRAVARLVGSSGPDAGSGGRRPGPACAPGRCSTCQKPSGAFGQGIARRPGSPGPGGRGAGGRGARDRCPRGAARRRSGPGCSARGRPRARGDAGPPSRRPATSGPRGSGSTRAGGRPPRIGASADESRRS